MGSKNTRMHEETECGRHEEMKYETKSENAQYEERNWQKINARMLEEIKKRQEKLDDKYWEEEQRRLEAQQLEEIKEMQLQMEFETDSESMEPEVEPDCEN